MSYQLDARPEDDLQKLLDGIPDDGEPASFSAPISAEGVHDLYLISDGTVKLYSWSVKK